MCERVGEYEVVDFGVAVAIRREEGERFFVRRHVQQRFGSFYGRTGGHSEADRGADDGNGKIFEDSPQQGTGGFW